MENLDISGAGSDLQDSFTCTPAEVLKIVETAWRNELAAPELLAHKQMFVDSLLDQIVAFEENLKQKTNCTRSYVHRMEIDRLRYVVCSYMRKRIEKIEKYVFHCVSEDEALIKDNLEGKMTDDEREFAQEYMESVTRHLNDTVLKQLPEQLQKVDFKQIASAPNMATPVFIRAKDAKSDIAIPVPSDDSQEIVLDIEADSQHVLPYKAVKELLEEGAVNLL